MKTFYARNRREWREWLAKHHDKEKEIWLVYFRKATGKPRVEYNDAVEEVLCFGWIDSIEKGIDKERFAQRFSPRKPKSNWSETNKLRLKKLIAEGKMAPAGLAAAKGVLGGGKFSVPDDILRELKKDKEVWKNFQSFDSSYKQIRIGFIEAARGRPQEFQKRLKYFLKMTTQNKKFGIVKV